MNKKLSVCLVSIIVFSVGVCFPVSLFLNIDKSLINNTKRDNNLVRFRYV